VDSPKKPSPHRARQEEALVVRAFKESGWRVRQPPSDAGVDLIVRKGDAAYAVEVKAAVEGRPDRLVPLFAQAHLQAALHAGALGLAPLAIVVARRVPASAAEQVLRFAERYAPDGAAGVMDFEGFRGFRGPGLERLNAEPLSNRSLFERSRPEARHLFSDLNQWMLKVLVAPHVPEPSLSAPRGRYRSASQLARAANVSVMSAFRLVEELRSEGYLHESSDDLNLVRREDLFRRWQSMSQRPVREVPARFLLRGNPAGQIEKLLSGGRACLGLFAAADALKLGLVSGVPPYVFVERLQSATVAAWKTLAPIEPGEAPDLILREAPAPQSIFRGLVRPGGVAACDVLQIWLDVSSHPSRGQEQAELIWRRVIQPIVKGEAA
jgi:hypothetical protein